MIPKFRAWHKHFKVMKKVGQITFTEAVWDYQPEQQNDTVGVSIPYQPDYVLMQSTGLHDKNGKEIFEGDIVKYWENIGYIEFYQGSWVINWNDGSLFDLYDNDNNLEVLGNIHEHPELLIQPK